MKVKKNMSFDEAVIAKVQRYADQNGISLSGAFSVLASTALASFEGVDALSQLQKAITVAQQNKSIGE